MSTDPDDLLEELREAASIPLYDERGNRFSLSDLLEAAAERIEADALLLSASRSFLMRAIVHPGPVEDEEGWDIFTLAELETQVVERLDREMRLEREVWAMRQLADEKIGRDADLARGSIEVVRDMIAMFEERIAGLEREIRSLRTFDRSDLL